MSGPPGINVVERTDWPPCRRCQSLGHPSCGGVYPRRQAGQLLPGRGRHDQRQDRAAVSDRPEHLDADEAAGFVTEDEAEASGVSNGKNQPVSVQE